MFRKPMRLEKWVAFDGAAGVEVLEAAQDAFPESGENGTEFSLFDHDGEAGGGEAAAGAPDGGEAVEAVPVSLAAFSGMAIAPMEASTSNTIRIDVDPENNDGYEASLKIPIGITNPEAGHDDDPFLPFWTGYGEQKLVEFTMEPGLRADAFFFEISKPANGKFYFLERWDDEIPTMTAGDWIILRGNGGDSYSIWEYNGSGLNKQWPAIMVKEMPNGALRIGILECRSPVDGTDMVETIFRSLAFEPNNDHVVNADSFKVSVIYAKDFHGLYGHQDQFDGGANGFFNTEENPHTILDDATRECDEAGNVVGGGDGGDEGGDPADEGGDPADEGGDPGDGSGGGGDDGEQGAVTPPVVTVPEPDPVPVVPVDPVPVPDPVPAPEPEPLPVPVIPPVAEGGASGGGEPSAEGGDSGGTAESGVDAPGSGSGGDSSGDTPQSDAGGVMGQDDVAYVHNRDDDRREEGAAEQNRREEPSVAIAGASVALEERVVESASVAAALELARDMEQWFVTVQEDKLTLEGALSRLRTEYEGRRAEEWGGLRESLRELFDSGTREMQAINRVLSQMRSQMAEFNNYPPERRDGMMTGSLRELLEGAERRSGETAALSRALDAVTGLLRGSRSGSGAVPDREELLAVFREVHDNALNHLRRLTERNDSMGKILAERRMQASAN